MRTCSLCFIHMNGIEKTYSPLFIHAACIIRTGSLPYLHVKLIKETCSPLFVYACISHTCPPLFVHMSPGVDPSFSGSGKSLLIWVTKSTTPEAW